jgi:lipopolysaccharide transport system permease protein
VVPRTCSAKSAALLPGIEIRQKAGSGVPGAIGRIVLDPVLLRSTSMNRFHERYQGSESEWRHPRAFVAEFRRDLAGTPELAWQLFTRNVRARYRQSFTGYLWAFIPPLAWTTLFLVLRSAGQLSGGGDGEGSYTAYLLAGLVFWQLFIESAQAILRVFAEARPMLGKIRFPREALVAAAVLEVTFQFLVRLPLLLVAWFLSPAATVMGWGLLPASVAGLVVSGCFVGILLLPLSLLYEDVASALSLVSGFWLLITPVAYAVPERGFAATLTAWNPAAILVKVARAWWLGSGNPDWLPFVLVATGAAVACAMGWLVARVAFPHLIARFAS